MLYLLIICIIAALDQWSKYWVVAHIDLGGKLDVLPGIFHLTQIHNTGAAFSFFADMHWVLVGVTGVFILLLVIYMFKTKMGRAVRLPLALVLGGAVSNLIDRIFAGYVVDMIELEFIHYPVFNIADSFINVGAILFVICYLVKSAKMDKAAKAAAKVREQARADRAAEAQAPVEEQSAEDILREYRMDKYMTPDDKEDK